MQSTKFSVRQCFKLLEQQIYFCLFSHLGFTQCCLTVAMFLTAIAISATTVLVITSTILRVLGLNDARVVAMLSCYCKRNAIETRTKVRMR